MKEGKLKSKEDVVQGLEQFPQALNMLFEGKNFGKLVLQVAPVKRGTLSPSAV
jgi:NADPH-dependent curcumin reductase CurA